LTGIALVILLTDRRTDMRENKTSLTEE